MGSRRRRFQLRVLPPNHPDIADTLVNLSMNLSKRDCHAEAVTAIENAVALLKRVRSPHHPSLIFALDVQQKIHLYAAA